MEDQNKSVNLLYIFLLPALLHLPGFVAITQAITNQNISSNSLDQHRKASAIFVFGDSTVDPGNNNFIPTLFRGNFMPYGRDFSGRKSTGRFSNGRLATDFIASYVGVKDYVPPYLDPNLSMEELMSGVSFASGGTGYDPFTALIGNVITMPKQLEYFKEYKKRIEAKIGKHQTEEHIKKGIFVISAGTNDFVVNYFMLPIRRKVYNVPSYERFVIQRAKQFLQSLWAEGARRMLVVGLPPMGCLPMVITLKSAKGEAFKHRSCLDNYSSVGRDYNNILRKELNNLQNGFASSGTRISYFDIYNPAMDLINGYKKFGFEDVLSGCCGSGYLEASFLCNPLSYVCPDASKYLFFDSIHPTETTYYYVFKNVCPVIDRLLQGL